MGIDRISNEACAVVRDLLRSYLSPDYIEIRSLEKWREDLVRYDLLEGSNQGVQFLSLESSDRAVSFQHDGNNGGKVWTCLSEKEEPVTYKE